MNPNQEIKPEQISNSQQTSSPEQASNIVERFIELYQNLNKHNLDQLGNIYTTDIVFKDALHQLQGLDALTRYFAGLYENLAQCRFEIHDVLKQSDQASLFWTMTYQHPRLNRGMPIQVAGASHICFKDKIWYHQDYADMGQMLYEHIPLLGSIIRKIKQKAGA